MYLTETEREWYKRQKGDECHPQMNTYGLETAGFTIPSELPLQTGEQALQWGLGISWKESAFHNTDALLEKGVSTHSLLGTEKKAPSGTAQNHPL